MFKKQISIFFIALIVFCTVLISLPTNAQRFVEISLPSSPNVTSGTFETNMENNFVNIIDLVVFPVTKIRLRGEVFFDANRNGIFDPGESGISRLKIVVVTETDGTYVTYTDENGNYDQLLYKGERVKIYVQSLDDVNQLIEVTNASTPYYKEIVFDNEKTKQLVGVYIPKKQPITEVKHIVKEVPKQIQELIRSGGQNSFLIPFIMLAVIIASLGLFKLLFKVSHPHR